MILVRVATVAAIALAGAPAWAHSYVIRSQPADGSVASPPPQSLRLTFDKPIEPKYAKVTVLREGKAIENLSAPQVLVADTELVLTLPSAQPGHYKVEWNVVGRDGHRTQGSFVFEAKDK